MSREALLCFAGGILVRKRRPRMRQILTRKSTQLSTLGHNRPTLTSVPFGEAEAQHWTSLADGTPFYVYDLPRVRKRVADVRSALKGLCELWYAAKANSSPGLLKALAVECDGCDVSSAGELCQVTQAGFSSRTVGFTGPGKTDVELKAAATAGCVISIESIGEITHAARAAQEVARGPLRCMLRVNPKERLGAFRAAVGGMPGPFGIPQSKLHEALTQLNDSRWLTPIGVHVHAGSMCTSAAALARHWKNTLDLAAEAAHMLPKPFVINFGGGLGIVGPEHPALNLASFGERVSRMLVKFRQHFPEARFVLEPGRYLVAEAGWLITSVVRRLDLEDGSVWAVADAGIGQFLLGAEAIHQGGPAAQPIWNLSRKPTTGTCATVCGPLCTPLDVLSRPAKPARAGMPGVPAETVQRGDLLAIGNAGAYAYAASPHGMLGHDRPAELVLEKADTKSSNMWSATVARKRRTLQELDLL